MRDAGAPPALVHRGLDRLEPVANLDLQPAQHRHLIVLERHGLVSADVAPGRRRGQSVTWRTETDQVAMFGSTWVRYVCSSADSPT